MKYIRHWLQKRNVKQQLYKLTDYELKDIGLTRGDIDRMVEQEYGDKYE